MPASARDVAAALRERLPSLGTKKKHKLLYYCQGHHLATFGVPLFGETISAWDMGPVVGTLWYEEKTGGPPPDDVEFLDAALGEAELNTIGYVVSRYGRLTGDDLERLTHAEAPWQLANAARQPGGRATIQLGWILEFFRTDGSPAAGEEDDFPLDGPTVSAWLAGTRVEPVDLDEPDETEQLRALRGDLQARRRSA